MSSRIGLYLERLSLDDLLFLEGEVNRRKNKFSAQHVVMAVQCEQRVIATIRKEVVNQYAKELRRYINESAAAGSGVQLAYTPDMSVLLFRNVTGAAKTAATLFTGLAELNGKFGSADSKIAFKLGLASGMDTLAAGSMRSVRQSPLVRRASQCAWKAPAGALFIDENCAKLWEPKHDPMRLPLEIEGAAIYRVTPNSSTPNTTIVDDDKLIEFLDNAVRKGISTMKYSLLREDVADGEGSAWSRPVARAVITLEAFDPHQMRNISFSVKCALNDYTGKVERIRRLVSDRKLGLVKHEEASSISHG